MESALFRWRKKASPKPMETHFRGCTLNRPIGRFDEGTVVPLIVVDFLSGELLLCFDGCEEEVFSLSLDIKED